MIPYTPALEQARHDAFAGADDAKHGYCGEKRIELMLCALCPFELDGACIAYQHELETGAKKPSWCMYKALIVGGDHE